VGVARSAAPAPPPAPPSLSLSVVAREFVYEPKDLLAKAGEVTFTVRNTGAVEHDFVVENAAKKLVAEARPFPAGKTVQVKARLVLQHPRAPGGRDAGDPARGALRCAPSEPGRPWG